MRPRQKGATNCPTLTPSPSLAHQPYSSGTGRNCDDAPHPPRPLPPASSSGTVIVFELASVAALAISAAPALAANVASIVVFAAIVAVAAAVAAVVGQHFLEETGVVHVPPGRLQQTQEH